ncbi:MAG TPA: ferredoxin reductase [Arenimonas sp.]|uniref:ferredoxin reductase n=1 Tax=Arenimonas sp. TaxID=1872635 RepID=UPI002B68923C|nr:ferredoxin reductase [Arenimonas sp.]HMB56910.1 ferredoxin reductase [Arenimonas sp.]
MAKLSPTLSAARAPRLWQSRLLSPLNDVRAWDSLIATVNPLWSLSEPRARVVKLVDEAEGVRSLWLKPNACFRGFRPGQHVLLDLEIDGVRQSRCFSFSQAPHRDGLLRLTIKRKDQGVVSVAAHALKPGQILRISQAQGHFSPKAGNGKLLLLAAGSGITPMLSILQDLAKNTPSRDVVLLQSFRGSDEVIFRDELDSLATAWPNLTLLRQDTQTQQRLDAKQLAALVPDWQQREALLCGPDGFMAWIETMYAEAGLAGQLQSESFGRRTRPSDTNAGTHSIHCEITEQVFTAYPGASLLDAAEAAGLQPRFGCRRGICRTCQCRKLSGSVSNLLTGQSSGPGEELIQLCISSALGDVELAL